MRETVQSLHEKHNFFPGDTPRQGEIQDLRAENVSRNAGNVRVRVAVACLSVLTGAYRVKGVITMSLPATLQLGFEDFGRGLPFSIFRESSNPFELPKGACGPRGRVILMNRMRMNVTQCEHCGQHKPLSGLTIDPHGPESPDNYIALCRDCQTEWQAKQGC